MKVISQNTASKCLSVCKSLLVGLGYGVNLAFLIIVVELGYPSKLVSIPIRATLLVLSCFAPILFIIAKNRNRPSAPVRWWLVLFALFWTVYFGRIINDAFLQSFALSKDPNEYLINAILISVTALGFAVCSASGFGRVHFLTLLLTTAIAAVLATVLYTDRVAISGRIGAGANLDYEAVSPLALSYFGALLFALSMWGFLFDNLTKRAVVLYTLVCAISVVPFIQGASRGGVLAIIVTLLVMIPASLLGRGKPRIVIVGVVAATLGSGFMTLTERLGSDLIERVSTTQEQIVVGSDGAIRLRMWEHAIDQFVRNPVLGNGLEEEVYQTYPHNLVLESLMATGIVGGGAFIILLGVGFHKAWMLLYRRDQQGWLAIVYFVFLTQGMFTGSLWGSYHIWYSLTPLLVMKTPPKTSAKSEVVHSKPPTL